MNMCLMDMMLMEDDYAGFLSVADIAMKDIMDNNQNPSAQYQNLQQLG
jgi:hypothetical protein